MSVLPYPLLRKNDDLPPTPDHTEGLYQHRKRPQWGIAILGWEKGNKRAYQFEDGTMRVFRRGFYKLFEEVDPPAGEATELIAELNRRLKETIDLKEAKKNQKPLEPVYPFATQLRIFEKIYPGGFKGELWQTKIRGVDAGRRLKRHRNAAIAMAHELLAEDRMKEAIESGNPEEVNRWAVKLMKSTNLVSRKDIDQIALTVDQRGAFADGLFRLLHGKKKYNRRFDTWLRMLRQLNRNRPSWRMATAIPALYFPQKQVCVRPSAFKKQAAEVAPNLVYTRRARRKPYKNYRKVAKAVKRKLEAEGYAPADMLDIHDFIWATLRPSAKKHIAED